MTEIRRVRAGDGPDLRRVRLAALLDTPDAFAMTHAEEAAYVESHWTDIATSRSAGWESTTFVAVDDGAWVGLIGGHRPDSARAMVELVSMWLHPDARGSGTADRLVDELVGWARVGHADVVELWVTRGNDRALRFYERLGFELTGDHAPLPSDPCQDELRMRRRLP